MRSFVSLADTVRLGSPVVRVFRVGLGRDPGGDELLHCGHRLATGETVFDIALSMTALAEFASRYGTGDAADAAFLDSVEAGCRPCAPMPEPPSSTLRQGRAAVIAWLAASAWAAQEIALLPGLAPGAAPDDPAAFALFARLYSPSGPAVPAASDRRFHFALFAGDTEVELALETLRSLERQSWPHWSLHMSCRVFSEWPRRMLTEAADRQERLALVFVADPSQTVAALRDGPGSDQSSFVGMLEPGDLLLPDTLAECAHALERAPDCRILTTDEMDADGRSPRFSPTPSVVAPERPFGRLALIAPALLDRAGLGTADMADGEELVRLALGAARPAEVRHVGRILCLRRFRRATDGGSEPFAPGPPERPWRVRVVVPTRDRPDLIASCSEGVLRRTGWRDLELAIIDNGSTDPRAIAAIAEAASDPRVTVARDGAAFNFARLNNEAVRAASNADIVVLLNDDVGIVSPDWLDRLLEPFSDARVGAVGARLLDPDGRIQHAGILLGPDGRATHVGRGLSADAAGYLGRYRRIAEVSAATGACLAVRRSAWLEVGGMDERLAVTWNDVDLCLRLRRAGLAILATPYAVLVHAEGSTRGRDDADPARQARFLAEAAIVRESWGEALDRDPFLNPNLYAPDRGDLVLSRPRGEAAPRRADLRSGHEDAMATAASRAAPDLALAGEPI